jgi:hypothetical protein
MTYFATKYASAVSEAIGIMAAGGWANESSGDVESPSGWFAVVHNPASEVGELAEAFSDDMARLNVTADDITGDFVVVEDSNGFVAVESFDSAWLADRRFAELGEVYLAWETEYVD